MKTTFLVAAGLAALVSGQSPVPAAGFQYVGCVKADVVAFPVAVDFFAPFNAQQCQVACIGFGYAAMNGGCFCGPTTPTPAYELLDESACSRPCKVDDVTAGICGGPGALSLYLKDDTTTTTTDDPEPTNTADPTSVGGTDEPSTSIATSVGGTDEPSTSVATSVGGTDEPSTATSDDKPTDTTLTSSTHTATLCPDCSGGWGNVTVSETGGPLPTETEVSGEETPVPTAGAARFMAGKVVAVVAGVAAALL